MRDERPDVLGMLRDQRQRVHRAAAAREQVDRAAPTASMIRWRSSALLLGRDRRWRIGLDAALGAARVVGHDRAVGEVLGQRAEPAGAHRRADEEQRRLGAGLVRAGCRRSGWRPGTSSVWVVGSVWSSSWSSPLGCVGLTCAVGLSAARQRRRPRRGSRRSGRRPRSGPPPCPSPGPAPSPRCSGSGSRSTSASGRRRSPRS